MSAGQQFANPNEGFPNPAVRDDLVDPADVDRDDAEASKAAAAAGHQPEVLPGTGAGTSVPAQPAE